MGMYDDASLVFLPSAAAGKDTKAYSVKPTDGTGDFTFSRGTDISATRVGPNGFIEKGRQNMIEQSNRFITTWEKVGAEPETTSIEDINGGTDAWLLRETESNSAHYIRQASGTSSRICTFSFYAKKKDYDYIQFAQSGDGGNYANFNISNGTLGNSNAPFFIDRKIEPVGNGWYRCSVTYEFAANSYVGICIIRSDVSTRYDGYSGNTTMGTYIMNAQVELGLVPTDYIHSTTSPASAGLLENEPRFDYSGGENCPSLLLEPLGYNTLPYSEYLLAYGLARVGGEINAAISPEGVNNAFKLYADTQTGAHYMRFNYTKTSDAVFSVFAKKGEETSFAIGNATYSQGVVFNLEDGEITSETGGTGTIEPMGNGWYKCSYHRSTWGDWQYIALRGNNTAYTGDGESGIYLYGAHFSDGKFPTSYIPTHGETGTRTHELCTQNTGALGSPSSWSLFFECARTEIQSTQDAITLEDPTGSIEQIRLHFDAPSAQVRFRDARNSYQNIGTALDVTKGEFFKGCLTSDGTTLKAYWNGDFAGSRAVLNQHDVDRVFMFSKGFKTKELLVFKRELSYTECELLTGTTYKSFAAMAEALNYTVYE